jgi:hypothetical protein
MPDTEILEFHSCHHSFPHVPRKLYPFSRPDGIPGQYHMSKQQVQDAATARFAQMKIPLARRYCELVSAIAIAAHMVG